MAMVLVPCTKADVGYSLERDSERYFQRALVTGFLAAFVQMCGLWTSFGAAHNVKDNVKPRLVSMIADLRGCD